MKPEYIIPLLCCFMMFLFCIDADHAQGPGTETIATLYGRAVYPDSSVAKKARVVLRSNNYLSFASADSNTATTLEIKTYTDSNGYFSFGEIDPGEYCLEIDDTIKYSSMLRCAVSSDTQKSLLPLSILKPYGTIKGKVILDSSSHGQIFIQVYGLHKYSPVDKSNGEFEIPNLPAGTYKLALSTEKVSRNILDTIPVKSQQVQDIGTVEPVKNGLWRKERKVIFNTTVTGAAIKDTLFGFPVLLRLTTDNFNFDEANVYGSDLMITDLKNKKLKYDIERWDSVNKRAEIWVRADTIFGNDSSHGILIHSSSSGTVSTSLPNGSVFDTSSGFYCVYHLTDPSGDSALENTQNHLVAKREEVEDVEGIIGKAGSFNGHSSYMVVPGTISGKFNFSSENAFTLSAWVFADTLDSLYHSIISKGDYNYGLHLHYTNKFELAQMISGQGWESVRADAEVKKWKFVSGVRNHQEMKIYIDGVLVSDQIILTESRNLDTLWNLCIGRTAEKNDHFWNGFIDEVRISNRALSDDWIKLCYLNQRKNDALLMFK